MSDVLLATRPRSPVQIAAPEGVVEQLRLVEPRGVGGGQPGPPPPLALGEVGRRVPGDVAGPAVVDQEDATQPPVPPPEPFQGRDVLGGGVRLQAGRLHLAGVDDQERQDADRPVPGVLEFLLLDRAGDGPADRPPLEHLAVRHLIRADDPDTSPRQPPGVGVAPEHLLGPLLEAGVDPGGSPVPGAVRLEVNGVEDAADGAGADRRDDPVEDRLAGQVLARPVGDVQALGHGLQAGQLDDLCPFEGGKSDPGCRVGSAGPGVLPGPPARSVGRSSRRWPRRTASGRRPCCCAGPGRWPGGFGHAAPDTREGTRPERPAAGSTSPPERSRVVGVFVLASGHLNLPGEVRAQHNRRPRIPCITYVRGH